MSMFFNEHSVQLPFIPAAQMPPGELSNVLDQVCDATIYHGSYTVIVGVILAEGTPEGMKLLKLCGCEYCVRQPGGFLIISDMQVLEWNSGGEAGGKYIDVSKCTKRERADNRCVYITPSGNKLPYMKDRS